MWPRLVRQSVPKNFRTKLGTKKLPLLVQNFILFSDFYLVMCDFFSLYGPYYLKNRTKWIFSELTFNRTKSRSAIREAALNEVTLYVRAYENRMPSIFSIIWVFPLLPTFIGTEILRFVHSFQFCSHCKIIFRFVLSGVSMLYYWEQNLQNCILGKNGTNTILRARLLIKQPTQRKFLGVVVSISSFRTKVMQMLSEGPSQHSRNSAAHL